jgi:hypothetical protein
LTWQEDCAHPERTENTINDEAAVRCPTLAGDEDENRVPGALGRVPSEDEFKLILPQTEFQTETPPLSLAFSSGRQQFFFRLDPLASAAKPTAEGSAKEERRALNPQFSPPEA